jgi:preprotein translocase subunit SecF
MSRMGRLGHNLYTGRTSFDFVGRKRTWYAISALILLVAVLALVFRGLNFGIEFRGGAEFRVPDAQCSVEEARAATASVVSGETIVQELGNGEVRVQTPALEGPQSNEIVDGLAASCGVEAAEISSQVIGPSWGEEVTNRALLGLGIFLVFVVLFISLAFEFKMAIAAIVALLHDIVITVGVYAVVGFDVTPATVIGLLTILGYSLYDTVVVFDSIRENTAGLTGSNRQTYSEAANFSVNQTLVRSINTSVTALLPIGAILFVGAYLLGAGTLKDLSLVLFVGIVASTYSSIFIATPLLADLKEREPAMQALARRVAGRRSGATAPATRSARTEGRSRAGTARSAGDGRPPNGFASSTTMTDDARADAVADDGSAQPAAGTAAAARRPAGDRQPATGGQRRQPQRRPGGRPSGKKRR